MAPPFGRLGHGLFGLALLALPGWKSRNNNGNYNDKIVNNSLIMVNGGE